MSDGRVRHLFVSQDYPPDRGGMARRHVELCRRLADEVVVSTVAASGATEFDASEPYAIQREPFTFREAKTLMRQLAWSASIARTIVPGRTIIHLGNVRPCGYAVGVATRRVAAPYVTYVNGGDLLRERVKVTGDPLKRWAARDILGRSAGIVANSAWTATLAREVMAQVGVRTPPPVAAIDLGTDPAQFTPARDTGQLRRRLGLDGVPLLVTVARLVPHKGQDTVVEAMASLGGDVRYLVVGEGEDKARLEALAARRGLAGRVLFSGPLSDAELAEAYATATVYVGLSRLDAGVNVEGFGISLVEASASGTPVVAGDSGGVRSAVRDGETGLVVPSADPAAAAAAIGRLLANEGLRREMGAAGRRAVEAHYNWDRVAAETRAFAARVTGVGA